jgi:NTE family protein
MLCPTDSSRPKRGEAGLKRMLIHAIEADDVMQKLAATSKYNADWQFLTHLHHIGYERADRWLAANLKRIGVESNIDYL